MSDLTPRVLRSLPKVELHRHLDGSIRVQTILDLIRRHNLDVGTRDPGEIARRALITEPLASLDEVLARFDLLRAVLASYDAIRRVTFENVEDAWQDGVRLVELRFAPCFIGAGKSLGHDEIIEGVLDGVRQGMEAFPVQVGLIGIAARAYGPEANTRALEELIRYRRGSHRHGDRIYAFDLADAEDTTDPLVFRPLVERAREAGMGVTVHTGENTTAAHLRKAVEIYAPDRIGHGIQAWGDDGAIELLRARGIPLEVCPTSNWLTRSVPTLREHPIRRLRDAGVRVSINSDDPNLMGIDLVHEYEVCVDLHGFGLEDLRTMNREALRDSFVDRELKSWVGRSMDGG